MCNSYKRLVTSRVSAWLSILVADAQNTTKLWGGSYDSDHISGEGSDVAVSSSRDRFRLVEAAIKVGISRIGIAKTFIHFGTSLTKTQEVMWVY